MTTLRDQLPNFPSESFRNDYGTPLLADDAREDESKRDEPRVDGARAALAAQYVQSALYEEPLQLAPHSRAQRKIARLVQGRRYRALVTAVVLLAAFLAPWSADKGAPGLVRRHHLTLGACRAGLALCGAFLVLDAAAKSWVYGNWHKLRGTAC